MPSHSTYLLHPIPSHLLRHHTLALTHTDLPANKERKQLDIGFVREDGKLLVYELGTYDSSKLGQEIRLMLQYGLPSYTTGQF